MDLLGSILNSMDKPPTISDKQKALMKKQKEEYQKHQVAEAEMLKVFREKVEGKINKFLQDDVAKEYKFPPMDQIHRSIIHDVAEVANVWAYSFGEEGIDRHIMIFKREYAPSEDQLNVLRRGEEWNEEIAKRLVEERERQAKEEVETAKSKKRKDNFVPNSYYKDKYQHLIGKEAALEAAKKTEANSSYGCVPSENKKDQRSIEQTLADIRAKKRKLNESTNTSNCKDKSTK
ncbi:sperm-associated antigen 7 homolog [Colletes gigas]|uniref:sperm-associated antigen 7 homolog n=1 Tax=Colletes gigas TaxID=935657 RepID=UPI001C9AC4BF|nr:sperm-associated antigen 7 homolog [Colletes gigas]XP_043260269.1 sperm-associated antigen 7 homolog [Colletes gigas]XP_043260271.1 sperm-associated antigen 7 homolog [Colletes gigas]XP_043260272.1 sperm-associated antigen 7 homolog [Colletes gigas]